VILQKAAFMSSLFLSLLLLSPATAAQPPQPTYNAQHPRSSCWSKDATTAILAFRFISLRRFKYSYKITYTMHGSKTAFSSIHTTYFITVFGYRITSVSTNMETRKLKQIIIEPYEARSINILVTTVSSFQISSACVGCFPV
jgi:hypothetical protein